MKIVECVPNFSEGKNEGIIQKIADAIKAIPDVSLLDIDPGKDTNRTVFTFVGSPENVLEAAFNAIKVGSQLIDMRQHKGAHPRMGACDVCPFVPVSDMTMDECVQLAEELGKRVGTELGIPVYLYEFAAKAQYRKNLADIRAGEYENLEKKISDPQWKPDFGPSNFNENIKKTGATVIGARPFLIAYNLNLNTKDKTIANTIAKKLREKGETKKNKDGTETIIPGLFKECKAIGWYVDDYKRAQISINLTNFKVTNMHHVFDAACIEAEKLGVRVTGSEIVGLVPLEAIKESGLYYINKMNLSRAVSEKEIIEIASFSLGLSELQKFDPNEKIIEYKVKKKNKLIDLSLTSFTDELASKSPAPGGGSVAALNGSLAASLGSMVGNLTFKKKNYENVSTEVERIAFELHNLKDIFLELIDKDTESFNSMMSAIKSKDEKLIREATKNACKIPFETANLTLNVARLLQQLSKIGNINAISDVGVGCLNLYSAFYAAKYNVLINLKDFDDKIFKEEMINKLALLEKELIPILEEVKSYVESKLI
ncbi:MAG: glutamate formimidoyltransferase [Exilispira sp.]|jgi:glutamate formiminotransferase/formiminotetrahydrofolate cyclodeaminase|nr:glutamate formimidoyltransferase [Exilispira sp.]